MEDVNKKIDSNITEVVNILRPLSTEVFSGNSTLSLSTNYLQKLNHFAENFEDSSSSFHIADNNISKANRIRDTQFIVSLFQKTVNLKIYPDVPNNLTSVNLARFANLKSLEILKIDINFLVGLQKLRSQLQEIICCNSLQQFGNVLIKCGGDNTQPYSWNELKKAKFSHNGILEIDNSFDWTLSLHTLDISHNKLSTIDLINQLPNLKYLNISYNRLIRVPNFEGSICSRLQILVLNNNFIEDLKGLTSLVNIVQLDLNQNSLIEHGVLLSIAHLVSLQYLNIQSNPFSFHPNHRNLTCSYLNNNSSSHKFLLNGIPLSKNEKAYVRSNHPVSQMLSSNVHNQVINVLTNSIQEKPKKIRNVKIEDRNDDNLTRVIPKLTSSPSNEHLRLKKQVEQLREEYGESWLNRDSGSIVQDVLGFEKSLLSSTPVEYIADNNMHSINQDKLDLTNYESIHNSFKIDLLDQSSTKDDEFQTASELNLSNSQIEVDYKSDSSDGEVWEECIYLVSNKGENTQVFVVVTEKFISERDVNTSKENARWHVNTIIKCEMEEENIVKLEFNTLRRDRKLRLYELDPNEVQTFYRAVKEKIDVKKLDTEKKTYQCMKCSQIFKKNVENTLLTIIIECPACDSNLVIES